MLGLLVRKSSVKTKQAGLPLQDSLATPHSLPTRAITGLAAKVDFAALAPLR